MRYCVITLDLVNSRQLRQRSEVQEELKEVLRTINEKYKDCLQAPFAFTLGDEVQGVLTELSKSYELIREFQRLTANHHFYGGIGYGDIATRLSERSGEMDGPAFHFARAAIDAAKKDLGRSRIENHPNRFSLLVRYAFPVEDFTQIVNHYLQMLELLKFGLTEKQREVYWLLSDFSTYSEVAHHLRQSKSAITQKIQAGHIEEILAGERGFRQVLDWLQAELLKQGGRT